MGRPQQSTVTTLRSPAGIPMRGGVSSLRAGDSIPAPVSASGCPQAHRRWPARARDGDRRHRVRSGRGSASGAAAAHPRPSAAASGAHRDLDHHAISVAPEGLEVALRPPLSPRAWRTALMVLSITVSLVNASGHTRAANSCLGTTGRLGQQVPEHAERFGAQRDHMPVPGSRHSAGYPGRSRRRHSAWRGTSVHQCGAKGLLIAWQVVRGVRRHTAPSGASPRCVRS